MLQAQRMADALLIADLAGRDELTRVQQLYMKKQPSPYMRVVKAIQGNDFVSKFRDLKALFEAVPYSGPVHLSFSSCWAADRVTALCFCCQA